MMKIFILNSICKGVIPNAKLFAFNFVGKMVLTVLSFFLAIILSKYNLILKIFADSNLFRFLYKVLLYFRYSVNWRSFGIRYSGYKLIIVLFIIFATLGYIFYLNTLVIYFCSGDGIGIELFVMSKFLSFKTSLYNSNQRIKTSKIQMLGNSKEKKYFSISKNSKFEFSTSITEVKDVLQKNREVFKNTLFEEVKKIRKRKILYLHLNIEEFEDIDLFKERIINLVKSEKDYSVLIKILRVDGTFGMAGSQINFSISLDKNKKESELNYLHQSILKRMILFINEYKDSEIELIQLMLIEIEVEHELKIKNINKLKLNKEIVKISETKRLFNYLPITMNKNYYGKPVYFTHDEKKYINKIVVEEGINLIDIIRDNYNNNYQDKNKLRSNIIENVIDNPNQIKIYLYSHEITSKLKKKSLKDYKFTYNYLIIVKDINITDRIIEIFDYDQIKNNKFGKPKLIVKDISFSKSKSEFCRKIGNVSLYVKDGTITKYIAEKSLPQINSTFFSMSIANKKVDHIKNSNIGVFDIETFYKQDEDKSFTYALGYMAYRQEKVLFYKKPNQSSEELIVECINSMLSKYNGYIFYVHNLHGFDSIFILSALVNSNSSLTIETNKEYYKLDTIFRDNRVIKLTVSVKKSKTTTSKITFVDSYLLLPLSLSNLAKSFECNFQKDYFPYEFVNEYNVNNNYIGNTPKKEYFKDISDEEYNSILKFDWNLKEETLKYLAKDIDCLMEIIDKFNMYIFLTYDLQITDNLTIAKLGLNILYKNYLSKNISEYSLPLINTPNIYSFIKKAYFGGICDVYIPYGENLKYYDINSEYPFVSKNKMPSNKFSYIELQENEIEKGNSLHLEELFGFFFCRIKTKEDYLGLLPLHINNNLVLPNGVFEGYWFSEELKFAKENGYEIQVIKGYNFEAIENVFDNFVDDLFDIRLKAKGHVKTITKLLLNSPFGRLGMSINKPETDIVNKEKLDKLLSTYNVFSIKELNNDYFLVNYEMKISKKLTESSGIDYMKLISDKKGDLENNKKLEFVSISTAAAITSYARIYINKMKLWIIKNGGKIFYSDTDSLVTDFTLPIEFLGNKLGKFKLEYIVKKGIFVTSKTYLLELEDGTIIKKAKGVYSDSINKEDYENMYYCNKNILAKKSSSIFDFERGTVNIINNKETVLRYNSYTKREKIFNDKGLWVDTKPILFSNYKV